MPSTYTVNLGIEKPATGEQSGTWGDTTNVNFDIIDQAINGAISITLASAGTSGSPNTLAISDGAVSDGRNKWIEFNDGGDLGATAYVQLTPNDAEKIVFIRNSLSGSRSVILFQGTYDAARDLEVPAGVDMVVKFSGGGATATVTDVFTRLRVTAIETPSLTATTADINGGTIDGATVGASSASTGAFTTLTASTSLNIASSTTVDGVLDEDNMASDSATKLATQQSIKAYVDSQVGTVDTLAEILANGNTSGANNLIIDNGQAITTNTVNETTAGSGVTIDSVLLKDDGVNATNLEITNLKANDGTAAGSIANSTGAVTITSFISNSVDIGGGAIDDVVIGGSTPAAGSFTTGQFGTSLNVDGTVTADGLTVDGDVVIDDNDSNPLVLRRNGGSDADISIEFDQSSYNTFVGADSTGNFTVGRNADLSVQKSLKVFQNGDISFYDSTSVSQGLFWDASTQRLGLGTTSPSNALTLNSAAGGTSGLRITSTEGSGFRIRAESATTTMLNVDSGESMLFGTGGTERMRIDASGTLTHKLAATFNEDGADADFRVESDANTHMLFVDAGNEVVSIGAGNTSDFVNSSMSINGRLAIYGSTVSSTAGSNLITDNYTPASDDHILNIGTQRTSGGPFFAYGLGQDGSNSYWASTYDNFSGSHSVLVLNGNALEFSHDRSNSQTTVGSEVTTSTMFRINRQEAIFNDNSVDQDFRVESDSNTHALFVQGSDGNVGIGASSPSEQLSLYKSGANNAIQIQSHNSSAGSYNEASIKFALSSTASSTLNWDINAEQTALTVDYEGSEKFRINSSGLLTNQIGAVFNESSADSDFRVESDTNTHALFVDAGNSRVGINNSSPTEALDVTGNVTISGSLSKGSGSFKIDHPVKPDTHHLVHSFVEAPQADNIYRGKVELLDGVATVNIDTVAGMTEGTFALLNREVQCFTSNESGWTAVRGKVDGNILTIEAQDNTCTDTISWLVIGERQDSHMYETSWTDENGKVIVEPVKANPQP